MKSIKSLAKSFLPLHELLLPIGLLLFFLVTYRLVGRFGGYTLEKSEKSDIERAENEISRVQSEERIAVSRDEVDGIYNVKTDDTDSFVPYITDTRTVKEYEGAIGLYDCFDRLLKIYDVDISFLSFYDRALLRDGIMFSSEGEAHDFVESLDS